MNTVQASPKIYLDNASTTRPLRYVMDAVNDAICEKYGNPSSLHDIGRKAKNAVETTRKIIADFIGAKPTEIYFTSGGSESDNLALRGISSYLKESGKNLIITSEIEHPAVLNTCKDLEKNGFDVIYMPVDQDGRVDIEELHQVMEKYKDRVGLVSVMAVNNEIGSIQLIEDIGDLCKEYHALFMTDAVQAYGHIPLNVNDQHIDILSASGHKIHALKGIGILYVRDGVPIKSIITGGGQERGLRAGTENVYGIISMGAATKWFAKNMKENEKYFKELKNIFLSTLDELSVSYKVNTDIGVPNIISLTLPGCESEAMLLLLNQKQVYVSAGSACTAGSLEPSHVLLALGLSEHDASCTIRISISVLNIESHLINAAKAIADCVKQLHYMSNDTTFENNLRRRDI